MQTRSHRDARAAAPATSWVRLSLSPEAYRREAPLTYDEEDMLPAGTSCGDEGDDVLATFAAAYSSPTVLAAYRPSTATASLASQGPASQGAASTYTYAAGGPDGGAPLPSSRGDGAAAAERLYALHHAQNRRRQAKQAEAEAAAAAAEAAHAHTPRINRTNLQRPATPVHLRLGVTGPAEQRERLAAAQAVAAQRDAPTFTPCINTRSQHLSRGLEEQAAWAERRARRVQTLRRAAAAEDAGPHTPKISTTSQRIAAAERGKGPIGDRLTALGQEAAARREAAAREQHEAEARAAAGPHSGADPAAFDRLHAEAAERARAAEEARRCAEYWRAAQEVDGGSRRPFEPVINARSQRLSRDVLALCYREPAGPSRALQAGAVSPPRAAAISARSAGLAARKQERDGLSHLPAHERLCLRSTTPTASRGRTPPPSAAFTPRINARSAAIDRRRRGPYPAAGGRVELLLQAQAQYDTRREQRQEERREAEAQAAADQRQRAHVQKAKRAAEGPYGGPVDGRFAPPQPEADAPDALYDRTQSWCRRRDLRLAHEREERARAALLDCPFRPQTTAAPLFLRPE